MKLTWIKEGFRSSPILTLKSKDGIYPLVRCSYNGLNCWNIEALKGFGNASVEGGIDREEKVKEVAEGMLKASYIMLKGRLENFEVE